MENFKELPLEVRLSAFLDGQVEADDISELEALIASDDEARAIYEQLKAGSSFGNQFFEGMLREPVPLGLVRTINAAGAQSVQTGPAPVRQAANSNIASFMRFIPQAIAASIMLLFAGGYAGYYVAENRIPGGDMPELISETSNLEATAAGPKTRSISNMTFEAPSIEGESEVKPASTREIGKIDVTLMEVADAHKVYAADKIHADEVPAARTSELVGYLEAVTSVTFKVPDLSAEGFKLRGGKLVEIVGQPSGALFYEDATGKSAAVYFMKNENVSGTSDKDGYTVVGGQKNTTSYFVVTDNADLAKKLEMTVSASF